MHNFFRKLWAPKSPAPRKDDPSPLSHWIKCICPEMEISVHTETQIFYTGAAGNLEASVAPEVMEMKVVPHSIGLRRDGFLHFPLMDNE